MGGGRFNRGGGRPGFVEQKRNFNGANPRVDHFRNNFSSPSYTREIGGSGVNNSSANGRNGSGAEGGANF